MVSTMETPERSGALRILIVEDNEAAAQTTGWMVEMVGCDYQLATTSREALTLVDAYDPEVIMMDIGLPDMNGFDLCRVLRSKSNLDESIFIALTGWSSDAYRDRALQAGFDYYLIKPIPLDSLENLLLDLINRFRPGPPALGDLQDTP